MSALTADELFELLPSIHRVRDAERGGMLRALVEVLAEQAAVVEHDVAQLYDNWFVETCEPWVLAYIGDLLAVRRLHPVGPGTASLRAYVANTLRYRRRKGTAALLEQLAFDVTGWRARAVEYFQLLATTQHVNHVRPFNHGAPDLRDTDALDRLGGPFERAAHTVEVRRIEPGRGCYNLPSVGLALWRLSSYPLRQVSARQVGALADGRHAFSPLGHDAPLFTSPSTEADIADLASELDVPAPVRRQALFAELEAVRQSIVDGRPPTLRYFDGAEPVLAVWTQDEAAGPFTAVPADGILVADLGLWQRPPPTKAYRPTSGPAPSPLPTLPIRVAVDPERGRLTFPSAAAPVAVRVAYAYGFSADIGGGPYDRTGFLDDSFLSRVGWQRGVGRDVPPPATDIESTLADAVKAWNAQPAGTIGVIALLDSTTYAEDLTGAARIVLREGSELLVTAADWPLVDVGGVPLRRPGQVVPEGRWPHLRGEVAVEGLAPAGSAAPGRLRLDGLLLEGRLSVLSGNLGALEVVDSTLVPSAGGLVVNASAAPGKANSSLTLSLARSITGPISLAATVADLSVLETIVDSGGAPEAIAGPGVAVDVQRSTILGAMSAGTLEAGNSILLGAPVVGRLQAGCVRFSYVPPGPPTVTPRRYRCQPDLALPGVSDEPARAAVLARMVPSFTTLTYGQPAYAQLASSCPEEIRTGSEDGAEMGVFESLKQPQRVANLRAALDEYLRFGLEAGTVLVT